MKTRSLIESEGMLHSFQMNSCERIAEGGIELSLCDWIYLELLWAPLPRTVKSSAIVTRPTLTNFSEKYVSIPYQTLGTEERSHSDHVLRTHRSVSPEARDGK